MNRALRITTAATLLGTTALFTGCASLSNAERGGLIGAGGGAVVGGAIGDAAGSTAKGAILGAVIGGAAGAYIGSRMNDKAEQLAQRLPNAQVERVGEGILVTFDGGLLFDFDSSVLRPDARQKLRDLAASLSDMTDTDLLVAGHTDSQGSAEYNEGLSLRRAQAARELLASEGIQFGRIQLAGLGEEEPIASNQTDEGRQLNRRVEIAIYANDEMQEEARERV